MLNLPIWIMKVLSEFAPAIYGQSTWYKVEVLVVGAILAQGQRTVSAVLRVMGLSDDRNYALYHQVLSRAVWSGLASRECLNIATAPAIIPIFAANRIAVVLRYIYMIDFTMQ